MGTMSRVVATTTVVTLLFGVPAGAQQGGTPERLRIIALEGQGAVNSLVTSSAVAPVVEVRDENGRPVEGAAVTFTLPESGPGGLFEGGQRTQTSITDMRGQAGARGYAINQLPGRFSISVSAKYEGRTGALLITQVNVPTAAGEGQSMTKGSGKGKWILLTLAGAGAGLGIYFGTRGGDSPISVQTGPISIGGTR